MVTLVTKDINLRLKAKALELPAEDYKNGQVRDVKLRFTGKTLIEGVDADAIRKLYVQGSTRKITMLDPYRQNNHYYVLRNGSSSALGYFSEATRSIERIDKDYAYGIKPRNAEQAFALHAITNPDVSLVTICGVAGTGKPYSRSQAPSNSATASTRSSSPVPLLLCPTATSAFCPAMPREDQPLHAAPVGQPQFHQIPIRGKRTQEPRHRGTQGPEENHHLPARLHPRPVVDQRHLHHR